MVYSHSKFIRVFDWLFVIPNPRNTLAKVYPPHRKRLAGSLSFDLHLSIFLESEPKQVAQWIQNTVNKAHCILFYHQNHSRPVSISKRRSLCTSSFYIQIQPRYSKYLLTRSSVQGDSGRCQLQDPTSTLCW